MKKDSLYLSIAGVIIHLHFHPTEWPAKKTILSGLIHSYLKGFEIRKTTSDIVINIREIKGIPFETKNRNNYSLYFKKISSSHYEAFYHISIFELCQLLQLTLMDYLKNSALFLHASSVVINQKVFVFLGDSGAGKSTTMKMLKNSYFPLADDSIIVRREKNTFSCYQTPVIDKEDWIVRTSKKYTLGSLVLLHKNRDFSLLKLSAEQFFPSLYRALWLSNDWTTHTAKNCIALLRGIKNLYSLSLRKSDSIMLRKALGKLQ